MRHDPLAVLLVSLSLCHAVSCADPAAKPPPDGRAPDAQAPDASATDSASADVDAEAEPLIRSTIPCDLDGVRSVEVPVVYGSPSPRRLEYRYRVFHSGAPDAMTVVVTPGGPGGDIMRKSATDPYALGAVPADTFDVIYLDARGSGCNSYPELPESPEDVYRTESLARDLLAVVQREDLKPYLLYGASYGTAQVTVAASLAATDGVAAPQRLVLEGTLGHAFASFDAYFAPFSSEWLRVKALLDPAWRTAFETEPWPTVLYWSREQWGAFISAQLIIGEIPGEGPILAHWLTGLSQKDTAAQSYVASFMDAVGQADPSVLFATIACEELWGSWQDGREIRDGELGAVGPDLCPDSSLTHRYDSKDWQVQVPMTYFHGPHDPTTTTASVDYHFAQHPNVPRQLVTVPGASHAPLTLGLAGRGCARQVWQALAAKPESLGTVLATCTKAGEAPVQLQEAPAQ